MSDLQVFPSTDFNIELAQGGRDAAIKGAGATKRDLLMVPLDAIKIVAGFNVRIHDSDYDKHVEAIKTSIIENGFYSHMPISGYAGKEGDTTFIYCAGGFTRLEAAKRARAEGAPIEALPVVLKPPGTSMIDLIVGLDGDNANRPLKPYERAVVVKRLIGYGADEPTVAKRLGISEQYVKELLYLMSLPKTLLGMVVAGKAAALDVTRLTKKVGAAEALRAFEASVPSASPSTTPAEPPASGRIKKPIIAKKTLFRAIDYAISLPGDGLKWLIKWRKEDADAIAELNAYKPPRKNATPKATASKPKGSGKGAAKGANGKAAEADPFDTSSDTPASAEIDDVL